MNRNRKGRLSPGPAFSTTLDRNKVRKAGQISSQREQEAELVLEQRAQGPAITFTPESYPTSVEGGEVQDSIYFRLTGKEERCIGGQGIETHTPCRREELLCISEKKKRTQLGKRRVVTSRGKVGNSVVFWGTGCSRGRQ